MPQVLYHRLAPHTQLLLWRITEPEMFFKGAAAGIRSISHPHKRLQHLCGRYLLQCLVPGFPLSAIIAEHNNKPFLPEGGYHFSISHCDDYVAAIVSTALQVGIDVETISPKVAAIRKKFLTAEEEAMLAGMNTSLTAMEKLTLAWSAKETMFKWLGETGVDFKSQLVLQQVQNTNAYPHLQATIKRRYAQEVEISFRVANGVVLTWLAN